jgi:hypothetical protein
MPCTEVFAKQMQNPTLSSNQYNNLLSIMTYKKGYYFTSSVIPIHNNDIGRTLGLR